MDYVKDHGQRCADTQYYEDGQIIDVMRIVSVMICVSNVAGVRVVRHRMTQSKNQLQARTVRQPAINGVDLR